MRAMFEDVEPPSPAEVAELRRRLRLTQAAMASLFGMTPTHYRNLERGRKVASPLVSRLMLWIESGYRPPEFRALNVRLLPED